MKTLLLISSLALLAGPAFADGDPAKGEKDFGKCKACHSIVNGDEVIQKGGNTGPNLYDVVGRPAGTEEGFAYGTGFAEAAEKGLVWTDENLEKYVADPLKFIQEYTGDKKARVKMTFKLKKNADVIAYLRSVSPDADKADAEAPAN